MGFKFEKLRVWSEAKDYCSLIYKTTKVFPKEERFCLVDQIRRAAISISLNISEGSMKQSDIDFSRFLKISQGSLCEVITGMYIALDQGYTSRVEFEEVYSQGELLLGRIRATINSLNTKK